MKKNILIVSNTTWSIFNFRKGLIQKLVSQGHQVTAISPPDQYVDRVKSLGCNYIPLVTLHQISKNPIRDLFLYRELKQIFRLINPDLIFLFTPKANIYGGMAAGKLGLDFINTINGLGYTFQTNSILSFLVKKLYRIGLKNSTKVFFQNNDDKAFFKKKKIIKEGKTELVPGSGVNTAEFVPVENKSANFTFLLCARLLIEKGVIEYLNAAEILKKKYSNVAFKLIGKKVKHPSAVDESIINQYHNEGVINYIGETDEINRELSNVHVLVNPSSYLEGIPKISLEALSKGLPIITTDSVGCKETVDHMENGIIISMKDSSSLVKAMEFMINCSKEKLQEMGNKSRLKALNEFDERMVINHYLSYLHLPLYIASEKKEIAAVS
jgi:glycosyltransferase involved in cell wall biosynthesis